MDSTQTIKYLKAEVEKFVQERDWQQFHSGKNLAISIACEAAELLEHFQWIELDQSEKVVQKKRDAVEQELADVMIAVLCFANRYDIDVSHIVTQKIALIKAKYPIEKAKGNFIKYTEL